MRARTVPALILAALAVGAVTGCSQIAAIAPVGGNHQAEVRYAAIDVLLDAGVEILVAPDCASAGGGITCEGETVSGERITAQSSAADPSSVTVAVGAHRLYSGSILDVLDKAARNQR
jgi:hypothetical protein